LEWLGLGSVRALDSFYNSQRISAMRKTDNISYSESNTPPSVTYYRQVASSRLFLPES
jgi:hypothetical protein